MTAGVRFLRDLVLALSCAAAVVLALTRFVAVPWVVAGPSMEPTLRDGDRVIVDLWTYRRHGPVAGEIAIIDAPGGITIVKRVASPPVERSGIPSRSPFPGAGAGETWYPVVGDNPNRSEDSRDFGPVPRSRMRGRVIWRYWPLGSFGPIS